MEGQAKLQLGDMRVKTSAPGSPVAFFNRNDLDGWDLVIMNSRSARLLNSHSVAIGNAD